MHRPPCLSVVEELRRERSLEVHAAHRGLLLAPTGKFVVVHFMDNIGVPMDNFGVPMENFGVCFLERLEHIAWIRNAGDGADHIQDAQARSSFRGLADPPQSRGIELRGRPCMGSPERCPSGSELPPCLFSAHFPRRGGSHQGVGAHDSL